MDNRRLKTLILYHIYSSKILAAILLLIMAINLVLGLIFKEVPNPVGSIDLAAYIFAVFVGFELFLESFSFAMINGISRKTYYISNILSILFISLFLGSLTALFSLFSTHYANNLVLFNLLYKEDVFALFLWCSVFIYAMINIFHFSSLVFYRLSKKIKYIVMIVSVLLFSFVVLLDLLFEGLLGYLQKFSLLFLGIRVNGAEIITSPYLSSVCLFLLSLFFIALSWSFLRKIETK
ncbi:MAG: hypothetical protein ACK5LM_05670 [Lactovum sp.]